MNLALLLEQQARERPDQPALVEGRRRICFAELEARAGKLAAGLRERGLSPGGRLLVARGMSIALYESLFAIWKCGASAVFIDPTLRPEALATCLERLGYPPMTGGLFAHLWRLRAPALRRLSFWPMREGAEPWPACDVEPDAEALLTFSSGSTALPKGMIRSHAFLRTQHRILEKTLGLKAGENTVATLPVFALANLASGMTAVIAPGLLRGPARVNGRAVLRLLQRESCVSITAAPAFYERMLETGVPLTGVRRAFVGGAAVFPSLLRRLQAALPDGEAVAVYGSSEAEPIAEMPFSELREADFEGVKAGKGLPAGRVDSHLLLRVVDDEIQVSGPQVLGGYLDGLGDSEHKIREGNRLWHRTGDAGRMDEEGRLWLLGRHSARQGNLFPFAVEAAAVECGDLRLAGLVKVEEGLWLAVEPQRGGKPNARELDRICGEFGLAGWRPLRIPVDTRHQSKVDYPRLTTEMRRRMHSRM